jgi:hypothetical protein
MFPEIGATVSGGAAPGADNIHSVLAADDGTATTNVDHTILTANATATGTWFVSGIASVTTPGGNCAPFELYLTVGGAIVASCQRDTLITGAENVFSLQWLGSVTSGQAIALVERGTFTAAPVVKAQTTNSASNTATQLNAMRIA